jgi:hypothetical protein
MRSSRYFYFIAGIYRQLEREGVRASRIKAEARSRQDALREVLAANEKLGVIGRDATFEIKQLPASVYWSGLRGLRMFAAGTSEAAYQSSFDDLWRQRRGYADDDKVAHDAVMSATWDPDLPPAEFMDATGTIRPGTTFRLTSREATDLAGRYRSTFGGSLLSHLLKHEIRDTPYPWEIGRPPNGLKAHIEHARRLSLLARGTTLQYFQLLVEVRDKHGWSTPGDIIRPAFAQWWDEARGVLRGWRPEQLDTLPGVMDGLRQDRYPDTKFMSEWLGRVDASPSSRALLDDQLARNYVRDREVAVKPLKSRLKHPKDLKQWNVSKIAETSYQFDYRHNIGSRFVAEILDGIERG